MRDAAAGTAAQSRARDTPAQPTVPILRGALRVYLRVRELADADADAAPERSA